MTLLTSRIPRPPTSKAHQSPTSWIQGRKTLTQNKQHLLLDKNLKNAEEILKNKNIITLFKTSKKPVP